MIFETLYESAVKGELILIDGGYCRWHLRRDGQITIYEIISTRRGAGSQMLDMLKEVDDAISIFARCPSDLDANKWYERKGFIMEGEQELKSGRSIINWRLML